jgi:hypothetical protein
MKPFKKTHEIGINQYGEYVSVTVEFDAKSELHFTGECLRGTQVGSCGQIERPVFNSFRADWNTEKANKLWEVWEKWHLNHPRAGCEHQRAMGWGKKVLDMPERIPLPISGWVYESEHPEGELMKPCPECGYKYGSAWLEESVPEDVLEWLNTL